MRILETERLLLRHLLPDDLDSLFALYRDPEILAANPLFSRLEPLLKSAVARPSNVLGPSYNRVSTEFWQAVHAVLAREEEAKPALERLQARLERLRQRGW